MVRPHQPVVDRHLAGDEVDEPAVHEMRGDAAWPLFIKNDGFAFDAGQSADSRADRAARAQPFFLGHVEKSRILDHLTGRVDSIDDERIDLALDLRSEEHTAELQSQIRTSY